MNMLHNPRRWWRAHVLEPLDTMFVRLDASNDERSDVPHAPPPQTEDDRTAKLTRLTPARRLGQSA